MTFDRENSFCNGHVISVNRCNLTPGIIVIQVILIKAPLARGALDIILSGVWYQMIWYF